MPRGSSASEPADRASPTTALVGREPQLAELEAAFTATRKKETVTVLVHGPSGIGKTALVLRFLDRLAQEDVVVLPGRCYVRETVPYKSFDGVVDVGRSIGHDKREDQLPILASPDLGSDSPLATFAGKNRTLCGSRLRRPVERRTLAPRLFETCAPTLRH